MVDQKDSFAVISIGKTKDTTVVVEAVVLDVHLKGCGPAPLPALVNIDVVVIPVERDSAGGTRRTLKKKQQELKMKFPPPPKEPSTHIDRTRGLSSIFPCVQHILSRHAVPEIPPVAGSRGVSVDMAKEGEQDQTNED